MDVVRELADRIIVLHNGTLVADGEPAEVIASPVVQEAYLGVAPTRRPHERQPADARRRAHAHRRVPHPARRRPRGADAASSRCCWAATAPARPPRCAPSWACGMRRRAASRFDGAGHHGSCATPQIARPGHRLRAREHGHLLRPHACKENMLLAARGARSAERHGRRAPEVDLRAVPGGREVLEPPGRQALGRAEADAGGRARHRRAARAADRSTSPARAWRRPSSTT